MKPLLASQFWRLFGVAVGTACVLLSQVRVGIVATLVGLLVVLLTSSDVGARLRRFFGLAVAGVLALVVFPQSARLLDAIPALASLEDATTDSRFLGRTTTWETAARMINDSPLFGWGPGAAGATLEDYFSLDGHVTSHNILLKYGVEGGIVGLVGIICILICCIIAVIRTKDSTHLGVAALVPLLVFGVTGSTVDTLPISFGLSVILGFQLVTMSRSGREAATFSPIDRALAR
jgi:O-antigen ligase